MTTDHGGPDAGGVPSWDFSTNANACGPAPMVRSALRKVDLTRYPDPHYTDLRAALGAFHGVAAERIVVAASASEFIVRMTHAIALQRPGATVCAPKPGYGDYLSAAHAAGLRPADAHLADLVWHTDPGSPCGGRSAPPVVLEGAVLVIDAAYEPLRLVDGRAAWPDSAWRLWSPNKALGLTGVRGAYAIAPDNAAGQSCRRQLEALAPSWPLGAHGVAMLFAWTLPETQAWLQASLVTLRNWKRQQVARCADLGWICEPSVVPFFTARWPAALVTTADRGRVLARLREGGIKLRDAEPLGLVGSVRISVQRPAAQQALVRHWRAAVASAVVS